MKRRLSDHQVWALEEIAKNGPGSGYNLMEERGHGARTLVSFIGRGFIVSVDDKRLDLTEEGRQALQNIPSHRLGKPNPRKNK